MPVSQPPPSWASIKSKPTTVAGFGITDMATQNVANASTVTTLNTAQVLAAQAGATVGSVGTYAFLQGVTGTAGTTAAGSSLLYADRAGGTSGTPAGTWRMMGYSLVTDRATVWLRIA